ncbi:MAG: 2-oxo-4-hydroxy-4-carboxy-5-ureidoimidazoline decarboxylase [Acidobacteria bacterium]|nr:2-oxo-4-hydroxy-4-carboxy-5-ureidoimidazoline decarboxylase [Acidobacteriota bacterium]
MLPEEFIGVLGWVFEDSPWVAERAWASRPFATREALHAAMCDAVKRAPAADQLALLRAHPDLGKRARMSAASAGEQSGAGLDQLTAAEHAELTALNNAYRDKFGFPFLFAVKGSGKLDIMEALRKRIQSLPAEEFREALAQVFRIAEFRLEETIDAA